jgi:hypothetical protein
MAERRLERVGRRRDQSDVRHQQREAREGHAPVPHDDAIQAAERVLDERQQRQQDERAREQQDRLGAADLAGEPAGRLTGRRGEEPHNRIADGDGRQHGRTEKP